MSEQRSGRDEMGKYVPGVSGNPEGKAKGAQSWSQILAYFANGTPVELLAVLEKGTPLYQRVAKLPKTELIRNLVAARAWAVILTTPQFPVSLFELVLNRLEGKVPQRMDLGLPMDLSEVVIERFRKAWPAKIEDKHES